MPSNRSYVSKADTTKPYRVDKRATVLTPILPQSSDRFDGPDPINASGQRVSTDIYYGAGIGPSGY